MNKMVLPFFFVFHFFEGNFVDFLMSYLFCVGVPHHLLGTIGANVEFTAKKFRDSAIPVSSA